MNDTDWINIHQGLLFVSITMLWITDYILVKLVILGIDTELD